MSAFQPSSAATSDRLVNKVAMCGALFAGVAFVGYRIVKNAVKKNRNKSDPGNYPCFWSVNNDYLPLKDFYNVFSWNGTLILFHS